MKRLTFLSTHIFPNYHLMNKYIIGVVLFVFLVVINSCDDRNFLGPELQDIDSADFFSSETAFDRGVLGIYQKLVFFYNYRGSNFLHGIRILPDDDATTSGGNAFEIFASLNAANGNLDDYYQFAYQLIARSNTLLEKQEELADEVYTNNELRSTHRGEALFLRGYMNFMLWNIFGTAPLVLERITTSDGFFPPSSSGNELLNQAITDLNEAKDLLPVAWGEDMIGRADRDAANGMLGKALLYRATVTRSSEDYAAAIQAFDRVQNSTLLPIFADNFDEQIENNAESIFEVQLGQNLGTDNVWLSNDEFGTVGEISGYWGFFDNNFGQFGTPIFIATEPLMAMYEEGDPRIPTTFSPSTAEIRKYVERPRSTGNPNYYNNARVMRYSDVLLMKAEAITQSGGSLSEAISLVNQIRERARNSADSGRSVAAVPADLDINESDPGTVMQWIMDERRRELAFEEIRWFDLRRWHIAGIIDLNTIDFGSVREDFDIDPDIHILFPIPASQVTDNPNLVQNPGY